MVRTVHPAEVATVREVMTDAIVVSSEDRNWRGIEVTQAQLTSGELIVPGLDSHTIVVNIGIPFDLVGRYDGKTRKARIGAGGLKIVPASLPSVWQWQQGTPLNVLHLSVFSNFAAEIATEIDLDIKEFEIIDEIGIYDAQIEQLGLSLLSEVRAGTLGGRLYAESLSTALAVYLLREHSSLRQSRFPDAVTGGLPEHDIRRVIEYIEANLTCDLTLVELADVAHRSRYHFARMFRVSTGFSPHQFVIRRRVERARMLVTSTALPLHEIAAVVGFADQSHLTRQFRRLFGTTPTAMRSH